ncbi:MAG: sigma 54-interacting transcriptional regulator, partial [Clostridia bacterium]|nr:sigma 54-interacting transcriptional regulator [Clostridia bacterium]
YKDGRFVEVNCGALPENLIESELFGYERGAFTGADQKGKKGLFEVANGGTLFLDEVSELPMQSQAKLLKVLQDSQVRRIGGSQSIKIDCRIISATNKDLSREVEQNRFRQDLLYRLNTVTFTLPPLRERREDIVTLSNSILEKANKKFGLEKMIDKDVMNAFNTYDWPGNVRELENVIYRWLSLLRTRLLPKTPCPPT